MVTGAILSRMVGLDEPLSKLKSTSKIRATKTGTTAQKVDQLGMKPVAHDNMSLQCFFDGSRAPGSSKRFLSKRFEEL